MSHALVHQSSPMVSYTLLSRWHYITIQARLATRLSPVFRTWGRRLLRNDLAASSCVLDPVRLLKLWLADSTILLVTLATDPIPCSCTGIHVFKLAVNYPKKVHSITSFSVLPTVQFLIGSHQNLDGGKVWEQGYSCFMLDAQEYLCSN